MSLEAAKRMKPQVWVGGDIAAKAMELQQEWCPARIEVAYQAELGCFLRDDL
jgi:hypothetical protein